MQNFWEKVTHIKHKRISNNRFEVAVDPGYHGCSWEDNSYEYLEFNEVASLIGLTPGKLVAGNTVCGVVGTYGGLNRTYSTSLSIARGFLAATTIGDYALFAGGHQGSFDMVKNVVDAYNRYLARSTLVALSSAKCYLAASTIGDYALFAGESNNYSSDEIDAYNKGLVRTTSTSLSLGRFDLAATTIGNYVLFAGGYRGSNDNRSAVVDAYNRNLVRSTPISLSAARYAFTATTIGDYALLLVGTLAVHPQ